LKNPLYLASLFLLLCFVFYCKKTVEVDKVERIMEDGVEVIINHLEPYRIKGEPSNIHLEKEFVLDTENDVMVNLGLTDIGEFDVDSKGNIYLINQKASENIIFKFDREGNFVHSFCRRGQGPGELQMAIHLRINSQDEIEITDVYKKLLIFNKDGDLVKEFPFARRVAIGLMVIPLSSKNYLILWGGNDPPGDYLIRRPLSLFNANLEEIKKFGEYKVPNYMNGKSVKGTSSFAYCLGNRHIFVGNDDEDYEVWVYDLEGNLTRKIKKDYKKVPISKEFIEELMKVLESDQLRKKMTYFPESFPPYQAFFSDDKGRLFVMTYEKGEAHNEHVFDIFNADGIFIGRKNLKVFFNPIEDGFVLWATIKENRFYCRNEKESSFKEFVVYKMRWE
jgi:hypothetical protein